MKHDVIRKHIRLIRLCVIYDMVQGMKRLKGWPSMEWLRIWWITSQHNFMKTQFHQWGMWITGQDLCG